MRYTIDIPRNHPDFSCNYEDFVPVYAPGGAFAYVLPAHSHIVDIHDEWTTLVAGSWQSWDKEAFNFRLDHNRMDILRDNGVNIGWILRNDDESLRFLQTLNGLPVSV